MLTFNDLPETWKWGRTGGDLYMLVHNGGNDLIRLSVDGYDKSTATHPGTFLVDIYRNIGKNPDGNTEYEWVVLVGHDAGLSLDEAVHHAVTLVLLGEAERMCNGQ